MNEHNILITGGAGFVGSNLAKEITRQYPESKITILDNFSTGKLENLPDEEFNGLLNIQVPSKYTIIKGHTKDIEKILSQESFDIVYHFGEYSRIVTSFKDIKEVMDSNLTGTSKVLQMCSKWNAKLIYSASSSKFGNNGEDENLSPYSWVKAKMVELIKNYHKWYGLNYEICYFYNVYGPGQIEKGDYATVVGIFENQYRNSMPLTIVGDGSQTRDFTHVIDIVSGLIKASQSDSNKEWHLRSGKVLSILELANIFKDAKIEYIPLRRGERFKATESNDNTQKELSWKPIFCIKEYIKSKYKRTNF
tara:strand:- start:51 stop:971 length:921 start_codon:yes stop_codon:yes gene_type:complete